MLYLALIVAIASLAAAGVFLWLWLEEKQRRLAQSPLGREEALAAREKSLAERESRTLEEARGDALARLEGEVREQEKELLESARLKAAEAVVTIMERHLVKAASSSLVVRIQLPSEDTKAKLIGREGRNIRAFEQVTQTDLVIDETPEAVQISCFDPLRREAARITLINLLIDGRIHPSRIEEVHSETLSRLPQVLAESAEREAQEAGIIGLSWPVLEKLGELKLRTSQGQNVWDHSLECCRLARLASMELGVGPGDRAARAALLHDIGKALGEEWPGPHALAGRDFLSSFEADPILLNAVAAHHLEVEPASLEAHLVILADSLSAARPGARWEARERHFLRLEELEKAALAFPGVDKAYAIQSGREVRVIVKPSEVPDSAVRGLAREIAARLGASSEYPGGVKVVVIREVRAAEFS